MSDPYIVIEFPDGQLVAQRVQHGTEIDALEDLWEAAWLDFNPEADHRIRVGLGRGYLTMSEEARHDAVSKLSTTWLGYRDAKHPAYRDDSDDETETDTTDDTDVAPEIAGPDASVADIIHTDIGTTINIPKIRAIIETTKIVEAAAKSASKKSGKSRLEARVARMKAGWLLVDARKAWPTCGPNATGWTTFLGRIGINDRTARRYMNAAKISASVREDRPGIPIDAVKTAVRKLVTRQMASWPTSARPSIPTLLRDLADDIAGDLEQDAAATPSEVLS